MKKVLCVLIIAALCVVSSSSVFAQQEVAVYVNGNKIVSEVPAEINNGSTMIPFRVILNALGVSNEDIKWNENAQSIQVKSSGKYIFLLVGGVGAIVDDQLIALKTAPYIVNGRTLIPLRFVSEALGAEVGWNGETNTVTIVK